MKNLCSQENITINGNCLTDYCAIILLEYIPVWPCSTHTHTHTEQPISLLCRHRACPVERFMLLHSITRSSLHTQFTPGAIQVSGRTPVVREKKTLLVDLLLLDSASFQLLVNSSNGRKTKMTKMCAVLQENKSISFSNRLFSWKLQRCTCLPTSTRNLS